MASWILRFAPVIVACTSALLSFSCGYVGDPRPPSLNIPVTINDLRVAEIGDRIRIEFTVPKVTTDNVPIREIGAVEIFANEDKVPNAIAAVGPAKADADAARYAGQTIAIRVRVASEKGRWSDWASKTLEVRPPLSLPADFTARASAEGVLLEWKSPAKRARVFRRLGPQFLEVAIAEGNRWVDRDAKFGQTYAYQVETIDGEARSERTQVQEITPVDTFAPAVPAGLTAVAGIGSIELAWDRNPESDLAAYRVYRAPAASSDWRMISGQSPAAAFSDRDVKSGVAYRYAVSAVDQNGNESAKSAPVEMAAP